MKTLSKLIPVFILVFWLTPIPKSNAQIWKKIKKKTEQKVGESISNKVSDKAAEITAKNLDKMLNADINPFGKGAKKKDVSDLPEKYTFEWKYRLQMQSRVKRDQNNIAIDYYLSPGNPYFGFSMPQMASMFTVMDSNKNVMVSYMEQGDQPVAMAFNLPQEEAEKEKSNNSENLEDYTITKLPEKKFMGFNSKGVQLENTEYRVILYYTTEAGVTFMGAASSKKVKVPASLKKYMADMHSGLLTYMEVMNKKDPAKNVVMKGISLDKTILVKSNGNYKFM